MRRKWQVFIIFSVLVLTIYNILPTLFYYRNDLKDVVSEKAAFGVVADMEERVRGVERESVEWLKSFCALHGVGVKGIAVKGREIEIECGDAKGAEKIRQHLPRAGIGRNFAPSVLSLIGGEGQIVKVGVRVSAFDKGWFSYGQKMEGDLLSENFKGLVFGRAYGIVGASVQGGRSREMARLIGNDSDIAVGVAQDLVRFVELFGSEKRVLGRYFKSFGLKNGAVIEKSFEDQIGRFKRKLGRIKVSKAGKKEASLNLLNRRMDVVEKAKAIVKEYTKDFAYEEELIEKREVFRDFYRNMKYYIGDSNVFVKQIDIDLTKGKIQLQLHEDVLKMIRETKDSEKAMGMEQILMQHIAFLSKQCGEKIEKQGNGFVVPISQMQGMRSFLKLDMKKMAKAYVSELKGFLKNHWEHSQDVIVCDQNEYQSLNAEEKAKSIVIFTPLLSEQEAVTSFNRGSVYVIAKNLSKKIKEANPKNKTSSVFIQDFSRLGNLMRSFDNAMVYPGNATGLDAQYHDDYFFEIDQFYTHLLQATREKFKVLGSQESAILEFSDLEERLLAKNNIETQMHQELLKWQEDYDMAQVDMDGNKRFYVPKPNKSLLWNNLLLSAKKYVRGDHRKILKWGLDLSGGKTVQIELIDQRGKIVDKEEDLKLAINELYTRVNKMGVSEVAIHQEGKNVVLDFPGSQSLTAQELITGSSMTFHIVNEKFSRYNEQLWIDVDRFLQEVWNEALVTNQTDTKSVQRIAWKHLGGHENQFPISDAARILKEAGLKLAHPDYSEQLPEFNDSISQVSVLRGENPNFWGGQIHPLMIFIPKLCLARCRIGRCFSWL